MEKISIKKKKRLKIFVLLENNQPELQCLAKKMELPQLKLKVLNTLSRVKLEYLTNRTWFCFFMQNFYSSWWSFYL